MFAPLWLTPLRALAADVAASPICEFMGHSKIHTTVDVYWRAGSQLDRAAVTV